MATGNFRIWRVDNVDDRDTLLRSDGYYWQDDECDEPMGPFELHAEAVADYHAMRPGSKGSLGAMSNEAKSTMDLIDRNSRDPRFHSIVNMLVALMMDQKIAPDEIRDAAFLASIKYMHLTPIRRFVYDRDDLNWPPGRGLGDSCLVCGGNHGGLSCPQMAPASREDSGK